MTHAARRYRAPGKLVLVGEYAVLDGATAVVAAIDRGVQCDVSPAGAIVIETPSDPAFVRRALDDGAAPPATYRFTDWNPPPVPGKAGFGGSAAATVVALLAASATAGSPLDGPALFERARRVHAQVQGSGSGIDVAASTFGGVLAYRDGTSTPLDAIRPTVVYSGRSSSTGPRVDRYLAWPDRAAFVERSDAVSRSFASDPVAALAAALDVLRDATSAAGIDWLTPAHARIAELARRHGGAAKPSGAGGGDGAVALFRDTDGEAAFASACTREGFVVVPVRVAGPAHAVPPGET